MTKLIEFNGETRSVSERSRIYGIGANVLNGRLRAGCSFEEAIRKPVRTAKKTYKTIRDERVAQREAILKFIQERPGVNCSAVALHMSISVKTVSAYIRRLSHGKQIQISKHGEYFPFGDMKVKSVEKMEFDPLPVKRIFKSQAEWYRPETRT